VRTNDLERFFAPGVSATEVTDASAALEGLPVVAKAAGLRAGRPLEGGILDPDLFKGGWERIDVDGVQHTGTTVTRIPISPIENRIPKPIEDPAAQLPWIGALNEAWLELIERAERQRKLNVAKPSPSAIERERAHVQEAFDRVLALTRGESPRVPSLTMPARASLMLPTAPTGDQHRGLLFIDDHRLLVQTSGGIRVLARGGTELMSWPPTGPLASGVTCELVVFNIQSDAWSYYTTSAWPADAEGILPLAAYDLTKKRWLNRVDSRLPRHIVDETDASGADIIDLVTGASRRLAPIADNPRVLAHTRDGRFAWVSLAQGSSIIELATGIPFVEPAAPPDDLERIELGSKGTAGAVAWHPDRGWLLFDRSGALGDHQRWWARITGARAAAFSPDGSLLAVATGDRITLIEPGPPARVIGAW
jgi:hypothetical protein